MSPVVRWLPLGLAVWLAAACAGEELEEHGKKLAHKFYLDGKQLTYVLVLNPTAVTTGTFEVYGPDGREYAGPLTYTKRGEIAFDCGGIHRHFDYDFSHDDLVLKGSKKDQPRQGDSFGTMPPTKKDDERTFVRADHWVRLGRPTEPAPPPTAVVPVAPVVPAPPRTPVTVVAPVTPVAPAIPAGLPPLAQLPKPETVAGSYLCTDMQAREHALKLAPGGTFEYLSPDGRKATGAYVYADGELYLDSGFQRRQLAAGQLPNGLRLVRGTGDTLKAGDPLGEMPPQLRASVWRREKTEAPVAVVTPPVTPPSVPSSMTPVSPPPLALPPPPEANPPAVPTVVPPVAPPAVPAVVSPVAPPAETPTVEVRPKALGDLAGHYIYRPNPLVTETWSMQPDGKFEYQDSNGAKAAGEAAWDGQTLQLQSGEVLRRFAVAMEKDGVTFTRAADDQPKISNDLASMSPSVLKTAKYERQK